MVRKEGEAVIFDEVGDTVVIFGCDVGEAVVGIFVGTSNVGAANGCNVGFLDSTNEINNDDCVEGTSDGEGV